MPLYSTTLVTHSLTNIINKATCKRSHNMTIGRVVKLPWIQFSNSLGLGCFPCWARAINARPLYSDNLLRKPSLFSTWSAIWKVKHEQKSTFKHCQNVWIVLSLPTLFLDKLYCLTSNVFTWTWPNTLYSWFRLTGEIVYFTTLTKEWYLKVSFMFWFSSSQYQNL